jgi:hypothetical protein
MRKRVLILFLWIFIPLVSCSGNSGSGVNDGSSRDPFTFAVMSDNHVYKGGFGEVDLGGVDSPTITTDIVNDIILQKANIVFATGDEVAGVFGTYTEDFAEQLAYYKTIVSTPLSNAGIAFYPIPGNHEYKTDSSGNWGDTLSTWNTAFPSLPQNGPAGEVGGTYYVTYKNSLFILLDEYATGYGPNTKVNQTWLNSIIAGIQRQHLFVFGHSPAFQIDTYTTDTLGKNSSLRDAFWSSLESAKADIYFSGHLHKFDFASVTGVSSHTTYHCLAGVTGSHIISPVTSQNHESNLPRTLNVLFDNYNDGESTTCETSRQCAFGYTLVNVVGSTVTVKYRERTGAGTFVTAYSYTYENDASYVRH